MTFPRKVYFGVLLLATAWCAGIVVAPVFQGTFLSSFLYSTFAHVCHQFPWRSLHLAGEPLGVCIRCTGIYAGFLASLALYPLLTHRRQSADVPLWLFFLFLLPMALDVALRFLGLVHGFDESRLMSGFLCGVILPYVLLGPLTEAAHYFKTHRGDLFHARKTR